MAKEMPQEIMDAIDKAMPRAVAARLQEYLKTAEHNEATILSLKGEITQFEGIVKKLKADLDEAGKAVTKAEATARDWEKRGIDIDAREKAQYKKDCDLVVKIAEQKAAGAIDTRDAIYQLAEKFFGNPGKAE